MHATEDPSRITQNSPNNPAEQAEPSTDALQPTDRLDGGANFDSVYRMGLNPLDYSVGSPVLSEISTYL